MRVLILLLFILPLALSCGNSGHDPTTIAVDGMEKYTAAVSPDASPGIDTFPVLMASSLTTDFATNSDNGMITEMRRHRPDHSMTLTSTENTASSIDPTAWMSSINASYDNDVGTITAMSSSNAGAINDDLEARRRPSEDYIACKDFANTVNSGQRLRSYYVNTAGAADNLDMNSTCWQLCVSDADVAVDTDVGTQNDCNTTKMNSDRWTRSDDVTPWRLADMTMNEIAGASELSKLNMMA